MDLTQIGKLAGKHKPRRRVGRGRASGKGKTCGRGHKGCGARSGGGPPVLREGGQMPLYRRLPKRGFRNALFRTEYTPVNIGRLNERFEDGAHVTVEQMVRAGLVGSAKQLVKVLGDGELNKRLIVEAHKFSKRAAERIAAAGGQATVVAPPKGR